MADEWLQKLEKYLWTNVFLTGTQDKISATSKARLDEQNSSSSSRLYLKIKFKKTQGNPIR